MNPIHEYLKTLPVPTSTKYFLCVLIGTGKKTFTPIWIENNTEFSKRNTRHYLYHLYECGVVHRRRVGKNMVYYYTDIRLISNIASMKKAS